MKYFKIVLWSFLLIGSLAAFSWLTAIDWFPPLRGENPPMNLFLQSVVIIILPVAIIILSPLISLAHKFASLLGINFSHWIALPITIILGAGLITLISYLFDKKSTTIKFL